MPRLNSEILSTLKRRTEFEFNSAIDRLDNEVAALKTRNSSRGLLKSGATLKGCRDLCIGTITELANFFETQVKAAVEKKILADEPGLSVRLLSIFTDIVPESLEFALERIEETAGLVSTDEKEINAHSERLSRDVLSHLQRETQKLLTDIELSISTLRVAEKKATDSAKDAAWQRRGIIFSIAAVVIGGIWTAFVWYTGNSTNNNTPGPSSVSDKVESSENRPAAADKKLKTIECERYLDVGLLAALDSIKSRKLESGYYEGFCVREPGWSAVAVSRNLTNAKTGASFARLRFQPENILGRLYFSGEPAQIQTGEHLIVTGRISRLRASTVGRNPKTGQSIEIPASVDLIGQAQSVAAITEKSPTKATLTQKELRRVILESVAIIYSVSISSIADTMSFEDDFPPDPEAQKYFMFGDLRLIEVIMRVEDLARCKIGDDIAETVRTVGDLILIATPRCASPR